MYGLLRTRLLGIDLLLSVFNVALRSLFHKDPPFALDHGVISLFFP